MTNRLWMVAVLAWSAWIGPMAWSDEPAGASPDSVAETIEAKQKRWEETAEHWFTPLVKQEWAHGVVVGVIDETGQRVWGFGRRSEEQPGAPDGDTVFEIGSITKVFTGVLLADLQEQKALSVDDPVNKFLPEKIPLLRCGDREMRLVDLATHSSGLPRMPPNWKPKDATDPYADYSAEQLHECLEQHAQPSVAAAVGSLLGVKSKIKWQYSNLGVSLLGHLLERKTERPYESLLVERVCDPLQMTSTRLVLNDEMRSRLIPGRDADGSVARNWQFACMAPCGGLHSTANDLLKFLSANMGFTDTPLKAALEKSHEAHYQVDERFSMGINWFIVKSDLIHHSGMTGGYNCFIGFSKSRKVGAVVLADTTVGGTTGLLDRISVGFLKALAEKKPGTPPTLRAAIPASPESLEKFVGKYSLVPLLVNFTLTREDNRLYAQLTGQDRYRIYPESDHKFFYKVVDAQITFEVDGNGDVTRLILHQNGADRPAARVKETEKDVEPEK